MRKPYDGEKIICPKSPNHTKYPPRECWDSEIKKTVDGKIQRDKVIYGVIGSHSHGFAGECEYTGHAVPIEPRE